VILFGVIGETIKLAIWLCPVEVVSISATHTQGIHTLQMPSFHCADLNMDKDNNNSWYLFEKAKQLLN